MKRRASLPLIAVLTAFTACAGTGVAVAPAAHAQQQAQAAPQGDLNERMARLEQRITDLQTVIATLQSFVKDSAAASAPGRLQASGGDPINGGSGVPSEVSVRVLALETQIRALTDQMKQVNERLGRMGAAPGAGQHPWQQGQSPKNPQPQSGAQQPYPTAAPRSPSSGGNGAQFTDRELPTPRFGDASAQQPAANPFAGPQQDDRQPTPVPQLQATPRQTAPLPPVASLSDGVGSRATYDASYQSFLRNDLPSAERGFSNFVKTYPDDPLAGNAYYWLGRTHFDRKQYEPAAKAFLAGYKKNKKSDIAPDSLLHLGMSLAQLGEKDAACSTFKAISKQYPDAPDKLKQDAGAALKKARC